MTTQPPGSAAGARSGLHSGCAPRVVVAAALAIFCWGMLAVPAWSDNLPVRLVYELAEDADACPDAASFRAEVIRRVAANPFADSASLEVRVRIEKIDGGYAASIIVTRVSEVLGSRSLESPSCSTLARAAGLAVVLMLPSDEPGLQPAVPPAAAITTPMADLPGASETPPIPDPRLDLYSRAPRYRAEPTSAQVLARFGGSVGVLPAASQSWAIGAQMRRNSWSLGAEAAWHQATSTSLAGGDVLASLVSGSMGPCRHYGDLGVCGMVSAGWMRSEGRNHSTEMQVSTPYAAAGGRLLWDYPLSKRLSLRSSLDLTGTLIRASLRVTGTPAAEWTAPPASAALGISISSRLW